MKITSAHVTPVRIPLDEPYGDTAAVAGVVVQLRTDAGLEGVGHAITLAERSVRSLAAAAEELSAVVIGEDPRQPERIHRRMLPDGVGPGGVTNGAAAALDVAVWDLAAKAADSPLYRLLGGYSDRVACYASLQLGRHVPTSRLPEVAAGLVAQGFTAMKTNLAGQPTLNDEVTRIRSIRGAIGPNVRLLADVNFRWTPGQAIRAGRRLEEFNLYWIEDPVPTHNLAGLAEVRHALTTPIAAGEALYSGPAFRQLFDAHALDFPMPDLIRVGGITPFRKIAALAELYNLPLACHLLSEISCQVIAAVPNGHIVEYVPWAWRLFTGAPELVKGDLVMSDRPGHGMALDPTALRQFRMD